MSDPVFCIDWYSGATAQVEIFSPRSSAQDVYELKYTPGFRATIRPPVAGRPLGPGELDPINQQLNDLVVTLKARAGAPGLAPSAASSSGEPLGQMEMLGSQLLDLILPQYVQADLRTGDFSVEIGMDEALLEHPWELMHDGNDFLCLRHAVGRFVNGAPAPMTAQQPVTRVGLGLDELSVLLISIPRPLSRGETEFAYLPEAEAETDAILQALSNVPGVKVSTAIGKKATYTEVYNALKQGGHHIVHFNGHAHFNDAKPRLSGLVLFDARHDHGSGREFLREEPPGFVLRERLRDGKNRRVEGELQHLWARPSFFGYWSIPARQPLEDQRQGGRSIRVGLLPGIPAGRRVAGGGGSACARGQQGGGAR